jgi:hypothetical protein
MGSAEDKRFGGAGVDGSFDSGRVAEAPSMAIPRPVRGTRGSACPAAHPALIRLSGVLGRDAAAFARRHRYAGLGRLQLIWNQLFMESDK